MQCAVHFTGPVQYVPAVQQRLLWFGLTPPDTHVFAQATPLVMSVELGRFLLQYLAAVLHDADARSSRRAQPSSVAAVAFGEADRAQKTLLYGPESTAEALVRLLLAQSREAASDPRTSHGALGLRVQAFRADTMHLISGSNAGGGEADQHVLISSVEAYRSHIASALRGEASPPQSAEISCASERAKSDSVPLAATVELMIPIQLVFAAAKGVQEGAVESKEPPTQRHGSVKLMLWSLSAVSHLDEFVGPLMQFVANEFALVALSCDTMNDLVLYGNYAAQLMSKLGLRSRKGQQALQGDPIFFSPAPLLDTTKNDAAAAAMGRPQAAGDSDSEDTAPPSLNGCGVAGTAAPSQHPSRSESPRPSEVPSTAGSGTPLVSSIARTNPAEAPTNGESRSHSLPTPQGISPAPSLRVDSGSVHSARSVPSTRNAADGAMSFRWQHPPPLDRGESVGALRLRREKEYIDLYTSLNQEQLLAQKELRALARETALRQQTAWEQTHSLENRLEREWQREHRKTCEVADAVEAAKARLAAADEMLLKRQQELLLSNGRQQSCSHGPTHWREKERLGALRLQRDCFLDERSVLANEIRRWKGWLLSEERQSRALLLENVGLASGDHAGPFSWAESAELSAFVRAVADVVSAEVADRKALHWSQASSRQALLLELEVSLFRSQQVVSALQRRRSSHHHGHVMGAEHKARSARRSTPLNPVDGSEVSDDCLSCRSGMQEVSLHTHRPAPSRDRHHHTRPVQGQLEPPGGRWQDAETPRTADGGQMETGARQFAVYTSAIKTPRLHTRHDIAMEEAALRFELEEALQLCQRSQAEREALTELLSSEEQNAEHLRVLDRRNGLMNLLEAQDMAMAHIPETNRSDLPPPQRCKPRREDVVALKRQLMQLRDYLNARTDDQRALRDRFQQQAEQIGNEIPRSEMQLKGATEQLDLHQAMQRRLVAQLQRYEQT